MRRRDGILLIGVAASLVLAVTLVLSREGARPAAELASAPAAAAGTVGPSQPGSALESLDARLGAGSASAAERSRVAKELAGDEGLVSAAERRKEARELEAKYRAEFEALREEQGLPALEGSVRAALSAGQAPLAKRAAGLRALQEARVAGLDLLLRSIVEQEPDVSDGVTSSLPRTALKLLFERAPTEEGARRVLARIAFLREGKAADELRSAASQALVASIHGAARAEVERVLRLEASGPALERALAALAADPAFAAARAAAEQGAK